MTGIRRELPITILLKRTGRDGTRGILCADVEETKILYVGDPRSAHPKGSPQNGEELKAGFRHRQYRCEKRRLAWNRTLETAFKQTPDINFVISAGDQVNKTGKPKEEEYAAYLFPKALKTVPVATTIGNHDSLNADYALPFL